MMFHQFRVILVLHVVVNVISNFSSTSSTTFYTAAAAARGEYSGPVSASAREEEDHPPRTPDTLASVALGGAPQQPLSSLDCDDLLLDKSVLWTELRGLWRDALLRDDGKILLGADPKKQRAFALAATAVEHWLPTVCRSPCSDSTSLQWNQVVAEVDRVCDGVGPNRSWERLVRDGHYGGISAIGRSPGRPGPAQAKKAFAQERADIPASQGPMWKGRAGGPEEDVAPSDHVDAARTVGGEGAQEPGFCLFGLIVALVVKAYEVFPDPKSAWNLFIAHHLLGYGGVFASAFAESKWSPWSTWWPSPGDNMIAERQTTPTTPGKEGSLLALLTLALNVGGDVGAVFHREIQMHGLARGLDKRRYGEVSRLAEYWGVGVGEEKSVFSFSGPANSLTIRRTNFTFPVFTEASSNPFVAFIAKKSPSTSDHDRPPATPTPVKIFQMDVHTACAGEAKTALTATAANFPRAVPKFEFIGFSLARNVCHNYGLCPPSSAKTVITQIRTLLEDNRLGKLDFPQTQLEIQILLLGGPEETTGWAADADVLLCSQPVSFCSFFLTENLSLPNKRRLFLYLGLPVMWMLPTGLDRERWGRAFGELIRSEGVVMVASSTFMWESLRYQFREKISNVGVVQYVGRHVLVNGVRTVHKHVATEEEEDSTVRGEEEDSTISGPEHGSEGAIAKNYATRSQDVLLRDKVLLSRTGLSGAMAECLLGQILMQKRTAPVDAKRTAPEQHGFSFEVLSLDTVLRDPNVLLQEQHRGARARPGLSSFAGGHVSSPTTSEQTPSLPEVRTNAFPYTLLSRHLRAAIVYPYDPVIFLFAELYRMGIPLFVPRDLWRFIVGPLMHPDCEWREEATSSADDPRADASTQKTHDLAHHAPNANGETGWHPFSPFSTAALHLSRPLNLAQQLYWVRYSDFALLPHLLYFSSLAEVVAILSERRVVGGQEPGRQQGEAEIMLEATAKKMRIVNLRRDAASKREWAVVAEELAAMVT